ncbi:hypothetical protein ACFL2Q_15905, partial [Thermodesulfobacteriota bacterium]
QSREFDECPQCGILVERYERRKRKTEPKDGLGIGRDVTPFGFFLRRHQVKLAWIVSVLLFVGLAAAGSHWMKADLAKRRQVEAEKKAKAERIKKREQAKIKSRKQVVPKTPPRKRYYSTGPDGIRREVTKEEFERSKRAIADGYREHEEYVKRRAAERRYRERRNREMQEMYERCERSCLPYFGDGTYRHSECVDRCKAQYSPY